MASDFEQHIQRIHQMLIDRHQTILESDPRTARPSEREHFEMAYGAVLEILVLATEISEENIEAATYMMFEIIRAIASQKELMLAIVIRHHDKIFGDKEG